MPVGQLSVNALSCSTLGYIHEGIKVSMWQRHMHICVYCGTAHNSQDTALVCPPADEWMKEIWHCTQYSIIQS